MSDDRPAHDDGDQSLSQEMISAGVYELTGLVELGPTDDREEIVARVFRAMLRARHAPAKTPKRRDKS